MVELNFDPKKVGAFEVGWWKAHNVHNLPLLKENLVGEHVALYGFTQSEAEDALKYLIGAVKHHDTRDWDDAVKSVVGYYLRIKDKISADFDPEEMAKLEVGWWRLHDELEFEPDKTELAEAFATLYAIEFGVTVEKMTEVGRLKAEATREHDMAEDSKTPIDEVDKHWKKAEELLVASYEEIQKAIT